MQRILARLLSVQSGSYQGLKNSTKKLHKHAVVQGKKALCLTRSRAWIPTSNGLLNGNSSKRSRKQRFDCCQAEPFPLKLSRLL